MWKARDGYGNTAALKTFEIPKHKDENFDTDLTRWVSLLTKLKHNSFARIFEMGKSDGLFFLASDFIDGSTAANSILEGPRTDWHEHPIDPSIEENAKPKTTSWTRATLPSLTRNQTIRKISTRDYYLQKIIQICDGLSFAYNNELTRPILQWDDILADEQRGWLLSCFRWAPESMRRGQFSKILTNRHANFDTVKGMCLFSPPEVSRYNEPVLEVSHIYTLGIILRWVTHLLETPCPTELSQTHLTPNIEKLKTNKTIHKEEQRIALLQNRLFNKDLEAVSQKACQEHPENRYKDLNELALDLRKIIENKEVSARKRTWLYRVDRSYSRNKSRVHTAIASIILTALLFYFTLSTREKFDTDWTPLLNHPGNLTSADFNISKYFEAIKSDNGSIEFLSTHPQFKYFQLKADLATSELKGGFEVTLVNENTIEETQQPILEIHISADPSTPHSVSSSAPGLPTLNITREHTYQLATDQSPVPLTIESTPNGLLIQIDNSTILKTPHLPWMPFGENYLSFKFSENSTISIQNLEINQYRRPAYTDPIQSLDILATNAGPTELIREYLAIMQNPEMGKWYSDAFERAAYLHHKHGSAYRNLLIREAGYLGTAKSEFLRTEEEAKTWKLWDDGKYDQALAKLPNIFRSNPETKIADTLARNMPRDAIVSEGQRLIYWLGQTKGLTEIETNRSIGPVSFWPIQSLNLKALKIRNSGISDLSPIAQMPIEHLDLSGNRIEDLKPLNALPLKELNLASNRVSSIQGFNPSNIKKLETLNLSENPIEDIDAIAGLSIDSLDLSHTKISDIQSIQEIQGISKLSASHTPIAEIFWSRPLPNLRILELSHTRISDTEFITRTPNLRTLDVSHTPIETFPHIAQTSLTDLDLSFTALENLEFLPTHSLKHLRTLGVPLESFNAALQTPNLEWEFSAHWQNPDSRKKAIRRFMTSGQTEWARQAQALEDASNPQMSIIKLHSEMNADDLKALDAQFDREVFVIEQSSDFETLQNFTDEGSNRVWIRISSDLSNHSIGVESLDKAMHYQDETKIEKLLWVLDDGNLYFSPDAYAYPVFGPLNKTDSAQSLSALTIR